MTIGSTSMNVFAIQTGQAQVNSFKSKWDTSVLNVPIV